MEKEVVDFVFVILHYNTINDTRECINSIIKNLEGIYSYKIVIVDNCSPNDTGEILKKQYSCSPKIKILISNKNIGFAKGNNLGYSYAKETYIFNFLVMLNNDTLLLGKDFGDYIFEEYNKSQFAVLGPQIITPSKPYNSNPGPDDIQTMSYYKNYIFRLKFLLFLNTFHLDMFYKKAKKAIKKGSVTIDEEIHNRKENVQLHGCFWVFSPIYTSMFDGINDKTFLYREEELLFLRIKRNNMKSVYLPTLKIYHKEDRATNTINKTSHSKMRFFYTNMLKSTKILIKELENCSL